MVASESKMYSEHMLSLAEPDSFVLPVVLAAVPVVLSSDDVLLPFAAAAKSPAVPASPDMVLKMPSSASLTPCGTAVSYTHLTLPTTPYV